MRLLLIMTLAVVTSIAPALASEPKWEPLTTPAPGAPQALYSPSTARVEDDRGTAVRAVDVKFVAADGPVLEQTWKVVAEACKPGQLLDVAIYEKGQVKGYQRNLSLTNAGLPSTRMARPACGLPRLD